MHGFLQDFSHIIEVFDKSHLWEGRATYAIQFKNEVSLVTLCLRIVISLQVKPILIQNEKWLTT